MASPTELVLVMPVYNEEGCIQQVIDSWHDELSRLGIDFTLLILNDGSRDRTADKLAKYENHPRIKVCQKANSGHGPTVSLGYRLAAQQAEWVFQVDSDDELKPEEFQQFWKRRHEFDVLAGYRTNRNSPWPRRITTGGAWWALRMLFGPGLRDANIPYRLIRSAWLHNWMKQLPEDLLTPNLCVSGLTARHRVRVFEAPVSYCHRRTGVVSIRKFRLWKFAFMAFLQTLKVAWSRIEPISSEPVRIPRAA
jgi:dolichol-phosphate mannosyltransferase